MKCILRPHTLVYFKASYTGSLRPLVYFKASYTSSLRPHTLVAEGRIHYTCSVASSSAASLEAIAC
jgi:hypothetical protein